jgi:protein-S-isoprenylcysteine O-methyltransferase Ste14
MKYIFEITWFIWFLSEIVLNRLFRSKMKNSKDLDHSSLTLIWITISVSMTLGITSKFYLDYPIHDSNWIEYTGLFILGLGIIIRLISIYTLGQFFTVDLAIHDDHQVIKKGFYKTIRHPSYSGSLLSFLGFGISMNNWITLIVIFVPVFFSFINRINIEEKLLVEQIGSEYINYKKSTRRLIPMIY